MRVNLSALIAMVSLAACSAMQAQAASERDAVKAPAVAQQSAPAPVWAFDEYLELHRQAGHALYTPPSETVLTKAHPPCPRARAVNVN